MEFGGLRGLTFDTGQDKLIQDLMYQDQMLQRKRAEDSAMAQKLVGDIEYLKGSNQYDAKILEKEGQQLLKEIGDMRNSAGSNWQSDPNFWANLNYKKQQFKNSKAAIRSVAFQRAVDEYQKYLAEAAKDPRMHDMEKLQQFKTVLDNYGKDEYGNYLPDDKVEPIRFEAPEKFIDKDAYFADLAKSLPMSAQRNVAGGYEEYVPDEEIMRAAQRAASSRPRQWEVEYTKNGIDPIAGIAESIKAFAPVKYHRNAPDEFATFVKKQKYLEKQKAAAEAKSQGAPIDPYVEVILKSEDIPVDDEPLIAGTFGSTPEYYFKGPDKTMQKGKGQRFYYTRLVDRVPQKGDQPFRKGQVKEAEGFIEMPLKWGEENGIVERSGFFNNGEPSINPDFQGDYELFYPDPKENKPILKVKAKTKPIWADSPEYSRKYNSLTKSTTGQRNVAGNEASMIGGGGRLINVEGVGPVQEGSIIETTGGNYMVTANGLVKQ